MISQSNLNPHPLSPPVHAGTCSASLLTQVTRLLRGHPTGFSTVCGADVLYTAHDIRPVGIPRPILPSSSCHRLARAIDTRGVPKTKRGR